MRNMTKEEIKLARELVAEPEWSWQAGQEYFMLGNPTFRYRIVERAPRGKFVVYARCRGFKYGDVSIKAAAALKDAIPNLADPVTVDSLFTVARKACGGDVDITHIDDPDLEPFWAPSYWSKSGREFPQDGKTFAEAVLNVLRHVTSHASDAVSATGAAAKVEGRRSAYTGLRWFARPA